MARLRSPEWGDASENGTDSSEGSDVSSGSPRQPWPVFAKAEAKKIANQKPNSTIYCPVCQRHGRAGATADMKGFIRHCETKSEHAKQHKGFLKFLTEAREEKGGVHAIVSVGTSQPKMMTNWENQGKVVTPFILIIHNFDASKHTSRLGTRFGIPIPKDSLVPLKWEILEMTQCEVERVDCFPERENIHTDSFRLPTCFAIFKDYQDLVVAHETLKARGCGSEGWNSFGSSDESVMGLFGYKASPGDMDLWDPERKCLDWKVISDSSKADYAH